MFKFQKMFFIIIKKSYERHSNISYTGFFLPWWKKRRPEVFCKKGVLENICVGVSLIK